MTTARETQDKQFGYWVGATLLCFFSYSDCALLWQEPFMITCSLNNYRHNCRTLHTTSAFPYKTSIWLRCSDRKWKGGRRRWRSSSSEAHLQITTLPWKNLLTFAPFKTLQVINVTWCIQVTLFGSYTRKLAAAKICCFVGYSEAEYGNMTEMALSPFTSNGAFLTADILTCHSMKFTGVTKC